MFLIKDFPYKAALFISIALVVIVAIPIAVVLYASMANDPSSWFYSYSNGVSAAIMNAPFNPEYAPEIVGHLTAKILIPILALVSITLRKKLFFRVVSVFLVLSGFASGGIPIAGIFLLLLAFSSSISESFSNYHQTKNIII